MNLLAHAQLQKYSYKFKLKIYEFVAFNLKCNFYHLWIGALLYWLKGVGYSRHCDAKKLAQIADGTIIYFLTYYENGEPVTQMIPASQKQVWLKLKKEQY